MVIVFTGSGYECCGFYSNWQFKVSHMEGNSRILNQIYCLFAASLLEWPFFMTFSAFQSDIIACIKYFHDKHIDHIYDWTKSTYLPQCKKRSKPFPKHNHFAYNGLNHRAHIYDYYDVCICLCSSLPWTYQQISFIICTAYIHHISS